MLVYAGLRVNALVLVMTFIRQAQTTPIFSHQIISECLCSTGLSVKQTDSIFSLLLGFEIVDSHDLLGCIFQLRFIF